MKHQLVLFPILLLICLFNVSVSDKRIINGKDAKNNAAPFIVALFKDERFSCAGTILSERVILTAAHCVRFADQVVAGIGNLNDKDKGQQRKVIASRIHAEYSQITGDFGDPRYDVALLLLDKPLVFNTNVTTVLLQKEEPAVMNKHGTAYGWGGHVNANNEHDVNVLSQQLKTAELSIQLILNCDYLPPAMKKDNKNLLCAGPYADSSLFISYPNICKGDSGGPLLQYNPKQSKMTQIGITSAANLPCGDKKPSIFVKVSRFYKWITTNQKELLTH